VRGNNEGKSFKKKH